jgi:NADPH-dependent glutamate synthase beta subunit-like oxidoreductase
MREVHRFIADAIYQSDRFDAVVDRIVARKMPPSGKKVAIVGAGPAGITCAFYLTLLGHDCTMYELNPEPGGMLRYALPDYRLPKSVLDKELELVRRVGVQFVGKKNPGTLFPDFGGQEFEPHQRCSDPHGARIDWLGGQNRG